VGRPLWWEDASVFCICCWPLPAQSFSGPSPLVLAYLRIRGNVFIEPLPRNGFCNTAVLLLRNLATDCLPRDCLRGNSFSISLPSNDYKHSSYCWARLCEEMFIVLMPSYTYICTHISHITIRNTSQTFYSSWLFSLIVFGEGCKLQSLSLLVFLNPSLTLPFLNILLSTMISSAPFL
jgi:hypothetical protein